MSNEDDIYQKMREMYLDGFKKTSGDYNANKELINEIAGIVFLHVNEYNDTAVLNYNTFSEIYRRVTRAVLTTCYIKYYTTDLLPRDALKNIAMNSIHIALTKILDGKQRSYRLEEARSKAPNIIGSR